MYDIVFQTGKVETYNNISDALERFAEISENMDEHGITWYHLCENGKAIFTRSIN